MTKALVAHREWAGNNPLRKWRTEHNVGIAEAASMLNASMSTIQQWESGATIPADERWAAIAVVIGRKARSDWDTWVSQKPGTPTTKAG